MRNIVISKNSILIYSTTLILLLFVIICLLTNFLTLSLLTSLWSYKYINNIITLNLLILMNPFLQSVSLQVK